LLFFLFFLKIPLKALQLVWDVIGSGTSGRGEIGKFGQVSFFIISNLVNLILFTQVSCCDILTLMSD